MAKFKDDALARGEPAQGCADVAPQFHARHGTLGIRGRMRFWNAIYDAALFAVFRHLGAQGATVIAVLAHVVHAEVHNNAIQPRVERAFEPEPVQIAVGAKKGFLVNVLSILLRTGEVQSKAEYRLVV